MDVFSVPSHTCTKTTLRPKYKIESYLTVPFLGTCGRARKAVSCSCLKGSMWRARHINHKGTRKERERKDWSVRWVVERLYWQKLPSLLLSRTLQAPATKMELNYYLSTQHRVEGNHITAVLFNENMQVISKNSHKMRP